MFFKSEATDNPEQDLWQAVLMRQVEDALYAVAGAPGNTFDYSLRLCIQARYFLTRPSEDLSIICANAGMDMHAVIEAMRKRIAEAPSPEEIASSEYNTRRTVKKEAKPKQIPFRDQEFTINGITRTATEWCLHTGIKMNTVQGRLSKGWSIDRAFTATPEQVKQEIRAKRDHQAQKDIAARNAKAKRDNKVILYTYNGETHSLRKWSKITGIGKNTLYKRINTMGMTIAQAIETPVGKQGKSVA